MHTLTYTDLERIALALDAATNMFGAISQPARIDIFEAIEDPTRWPTARKIIINDGITLWQALDMCGYDATSTYIPTPTEIVDALEFGVALDPDHR